MLDLGANLECTPENLLEFAIMGSELAKSVDGNPNPTVGLLNTGSEDGKGNEGVKAAGKLIAESGVNYLGFVVGVIGLVSVVPGLHDLAGLFGMTQIIWFVWVGIILLRSSPNAEV